VVNLLEEAARDFADAVGGNPMSGNQVITPGTAHINLSAYAFHKWANEYYQCRLSLPPTHDFSPVPYFLLCRAIELKLKSVHLERSKQKAVKDRFGHDLVKSYKALPTALQTLSSTEDALLQKTNSIYMTKGFEYLNVLDAIKGFSTFPDLAALDALAKKLLAIPPPTP
jgi:hypothetical protein